MCRRSLTVLAKVNIPPQVQKQEAPRTGYPDWVGQDARLGKSASLPGPRMRGTVGTRRLILRIVLSSLICLGRYTMPAFRTQCSWCVIIQNRKQRRAMSDFKRLGVVTGVVSFGIIGICLLGIRVI